MEEPTGFALADVWKGVRRVTGAYPTMAIERLERQDFDAIPLGGRFAPYLIWDVRISLVES